MRRFAVLGAGLLLAAGCNRNGLPANVPVQGRAQLQAFSDCGEFESYVEDTAVAAMRLQVDQLKEPWGMVGVDFAGPPRVGYAMPETAGAPATQTTSAGPTAYTQTNNQVAGVDEGDIVKNDGTRILALSGQQLYLTSSWPPASLAVAGSIEIEGYPGELFLKGNTAIVISSLWSFMPYFVDDTVAGVSASPGIMPAYAPPSTKITVLDVQDLASPKVKSELYFSGYYQAGRQIGSALRLVLSHDFRWPEGVTFYPTNYTGSWDLKEPAFQRALEDLKTQNEKLIRARAAKDWLPTLQKRLGGDDLKEVSLSCSDFSRSRVPTWLGYVDVMTLPIDDLTASPTLIGVVAQPGLVYASATSLYVGSPHWWFWPEPGQTTFTYLYKFDLTDPARARFVSAGGVEGFPLNQYSLDETNGFLRMATRLERRVTDPTLSWGRLEFSNRVSVLSDINGALQVVGQTEEIAKGEALMSSRFLGDRGYLVTFRNVDPLFTVDLSNPTKPKVVGELTVPGFSTYLHPLDENHLIALGTYLPEAGGWVDARLQLSLFDVTDIAHPVQKFTQLVGTWSGSSPAQYDPHAFNFFREKGLLAIPYADWAAGATSGTDYWSGFTSELRVFGVDVNIGFTAKGAISMKDMFQSGPTTWAWYWWPTVQRSVMADDFVYAISTAGIRVATANDLAHPLATAPFLIPAP